MVIRCKVEGCPVLSGSQLDASECAIALSSLGTEDPEVPRCLWFQSDFGVPLPGYAGQE